MAALEDTARYALKLAPQDHIAWLEAQEALVRCRARRSYVEAFQAAMQATPASPAAN